MDRFYRGFFSGVVAGIPMNIWSLFSFHVLNFTNLRYLDWAGLILFGDLPTTLIQNVIAQTMQFMWLGALGVIFIYLLPHTTTRYHTGKAVIFSIIAGFIIYAIPVLLQFPHLTQISTNTVIDNQLGGVIWGIGLGYWSRRLDQG